MSKHLSKDESVRIAKETKALILANKGRLSIKAFIDEAVEEKVDKKNIKINEIEIK
jgi:hypothetical protein